MMDSASIMQDTASDLDQRIAERVRELRAAQGLSLDALARKSGVSRSMISLIERGESSPTAVVLEKLAAGLGVMLASLFDAPAAADPHGPVARRADQPQWQDPASGYLRRNVSPPGVPQPMQIVEVQFPPGQRVAFETGARDTRVYQQVWVLEGDDEIAARQPGFQGFAELGHCPILSVRHAGALAKRANPDSTATRKAPAPRT
jgi:transcriptional regulator with XRE-family HTH domain